MKNVYYMLAYAYRMLNEDGYKSIQAEEFENFPDLMAAILIRGVTNQCKRGLYKDYIAHSEVTGNLRGKIDITNSIKQNTYMMRSMICEYDDFSENVLLNQILKTTMQILYRSGEVKESNRKVLRKLSLYFENVDTLEPHAINWSSLTYHRNNGTYKMLMNICYLVIKGLLMTTESGDYKMRKFLDDQQMHRLYEKFLIAYFKKEYPQYSPSASYIDWNVDDGITDFLPSMQSDITLTKDSKTLIIDAKYYGNTIQTHAMYDSKSIISNNLYQIFTYVKNKDRNGSGNVSGLILYAKTDEEITPNHSYQLGGNRVCVKTLDLGAEWADIVSELDNVTSLMH